MDENTLASIIQNEGFEFYDTEVVSENNHNIYRVYITKQGGVTLDDCATITHIISPLLDIKPPIKGKYFLEVSSPGVERKLKKPRHFMTSIGEEIKVWLINTDIIIGKLTKADENTFEMEEDSKLITISYDEIDKAKTYVPW